MNAFYFSSCLFHLHSDGVSKIDLLDVYFCLWITMVIIKLQQ